MQTCLRSKVFTQHCATRQSKINSVQILSICKMRYWNKLDFRSSTLLLTFVARCSEMLCKLESLFADATLFSFAPTSYWHDCMIAIQDRNSDENLGISTRLIISVCLYNLIYKMKSGTLKISTNHSSQDTLKSLLRIASSSSAPALLMRRWGHFPTRSRSESVFWPFWG